MEGLQLMAKIRQVNCRNQMDGWRLKRVSAMTLLGYALMQKSANIRQGAVRKFFL
jgi:hypothetical protein